MQQVADWLEKHRYVPEAGTCRDRALYGRPVPGTILYYVIAVLAVAAAVIAGMAGANGERLRPNMRTG